MKTGRTLWKLCVYALFVFLSIGLAWADKDLCNDLDGLWVLTEKSPVNPENSTPNGFPNIRWFFDAKTNTLFQSMPDDKNKPGSNKEQSKAYRCEESYINYPNDKDETVTLIESVTSTRLELKNTLISSYFGKKTTYLIFTRNHFQSINQRYEPISVEVLNYKDNKLNILDVLYDLNDYSSQDVKDRIMGVWEVNRYEKYPRTEFPPYGLLNDIYTIRQNNICMLKRYPPEKTVCYDYELKGNELTFFMDDQQYTEIVSFNEWGHLELTSGSTKQSLKLINKDPFISPKMPLKVILSTVK